MKNKKGEVLYEQIIFIVLNVTFFSILVGFIYLQGNSLSVIEENAAKQIALIIDEADSGYEVEIDLGYLFDKVEIDKESSLRIDNEKNLVIVKASEDSSYEYSYFNDVDVKYKIEGDNLILEIE